MAIRKLPRNFGAAVMPFLLSILMTCVVSAISVLRTQGLTPDALADWPGAWLLSWVVAFPVLLLVLPMVRRLSAMLVES